MKKKTSLKNGQKTWIDIFPQKTYRWLTCTCAYIYIDTQTYAVRKNEIFPFTTWLDLENIMFREINQRQTICYHLYVESKK